MVMVMRSYLLRDVVGVVRADADVVTAVVVGAVAAAVVLRRVMHDDVAVARAGRR